MNCWGGGAAQTASMADDRLVTKVNHFHNGVVVAYQRPADVVVSVVAQPHHPAVGAVETLLGRTPALAAWRAAGLRPLPALQPLLGGVVALVFFENRPKFDDAP